MRLALADNWLAPGICLYLEPLSFRIANELCTPVAFTSSNLLALPYGSRSRLCIQAVSGFLTWTASHRYYGVRPTCYTQCRP